MIEKGHEGVLHLKMMASIIRLLRMKYPVYIWLPVPADSDSTSAFYVVDQTELIYRQLLCYCKETAKFAYLTFFPPPLYLRKMQSGTLPVDIHEQSALSYSPAPPLWGAPTVHNIIMRSRNSVKL